MTDQELKKLKRDELLQIMIAQSKRINALKKRLSVVEKELAEKKLLLKETGNIAEASLRLNHVFEDAQAAADQYLYNIKLMALRYQKALEKLEGKPEAKAAEAGGTAEAEVGQEESQESSSLANEIADGILPDGETGLEESESKDDDEEVEYEEDDEDYDEEDDEEYDDEEVEEDDEDDDEKEE